MKYTISPIKYSRQYGCASLNKPFNLVPSLQKTQGIQKLNDIIWMTGQILKLDILHTTNLLSSTCQHIKKRNGMGNTDLNGKKYKRIKWIKCN